MKSSSVEFQDIPHQQTSILKPFFHVVLPIAAPGINASYMPALDNDGHMTLVHTPAAKQFLKDAGWLLRDQSNIKLFDWSLFHAISTSKEKVPLDVTLKFHLKSLWSSDVDGRVKITMDALFAHFVSLAPYDYTSNWNDNRPTALHIYKDVLPSKTVSIEIEVRCCVVSGK